MSKPTIAVDLDDVLGDENGAVISFINETYGTNHTLEDYYNVDADYNSTWETVWAVEKPEAEERYQAFLKSSHKLNMKPVPGAIPVLRKLITKYKLVIITARDSNWVDITHAWLDDHYPDIFEGVHFVPMWGDGTSSKGDIAKELKAEYLIDDHPGHCELAAKHGIKCLLFGEYAYNKNTEPTKNITKVKDWKAVEAYFDD